MKETIKKTCLLLLLFIAINHSFAQSETFTYYGNSLNEVTESNSSAPRFASLIKKGKQIWVKIYNPATQTLAATIRLKAIPSRSQAYYSYQTYYQYDSSFTCSLKMTKDSSCKIDFDKETASLTVRNSLGLITNRFIFPISQTKNVFIEQTFYTNGKVRKEFSYSEGGVALFNDQKRGFGSLFSPIAK